MASKRLANYADGLVEETLVEAATTFFGARVALEKEIERYEDATARLERVEEGVLRRAATLHFLLLEGAAVQEFYELISVEPGHLLDAAEVVDRGVSELKIPFGLTRASRYAGLVLAAYEDLDRAVEAYLHGEYYTDSHGRKRVSVNYAQLQEWCGKLNAKIQALNSDHSPTGTLCFVKGLDPTLLKRESLSEATLEGYAQELDRELAFKPVECFALNYLAPPELPGEEAVRGVIRRFCKGLCSKAPQEVADILRRFKRG
ncbi:hypothetical protein [Desulfocurvus sp. DL9XJH121]